MLRTLFPPPASWLWGFMGRRKQRFTSDLAQTGIGHVVEGVACDHVGGGRRSDVHLRGDKNMVIGTDVQTTHRATTSVTFRTSTPGITTPSSASNRILAMSSIRYWRGTSIWSTITTSLRVCTGALNSW